MSLPLIFRPEAENDVLQARDWYERRRAGLGDKFGGAITQLLDRIQLSPELYAPTVGAIRRAKVRRFPYVVYSRIAERYVEVLAVLHGGRHPFSFGERL